jgi:transposase
LSREQLIELVLAQGATIARLEAKVAELERQLGQNSGNSSKPSSRDPVAERKRQAEARKARKGGGGRKRGKQPGAKGVGPKRVADPDEIIDHRPQACQGCGASLEGAVSEGYQARQVIDVPEVAPTTTEHRAHTCRCSCGQTTSGRFPSWVRAPVSYGPKVRAVVAYLLARQHLPGRRVAEVMADLCGLDISTGSIDAIYTDAARRLGGFITALVAFLRTLPVLHADETTDRVGVATCWMHVVSTGAYTLIHASVTRGTEAMRAAGVLIGYTGVVVHDRLAMYWKLKAKHAVCGAHLLRDLAEVATIASQTAWAAGLAALLVEINHACDDARERGLKALAPARRRDFAARYDTLVAKGRSVNPEPPRGAKRGYYARRAHNLVVAFETHKTEILRFMHHLDVPLTNNQAERDLRPTKLHRKISGCFRSQHGAKRYAHLRSYLSTTRKNGVPAIDALTRLFNGDPWMPPQPC